MHAEAAQVKLTATAQTTKIHNIPAQFIECKLFLTNGISRNARSFSSFTAIQLGTMSLGFYFSYN
jgi:hypothetical protein